MNREAMIQLKRVLGYIPDDKLNMHHWRTCACGRAADDRWFIERKFQPNSYDAAAQFFDIPYDDAVRIFSPGSYGHGCVTPAMVMERIDEMLAREDSSLHTRRQAIIDALLEAALKPTTRTLVSIAAVLLLLPR